VALSIAHVRAGNPSAQAMSRSSCFGPDRTRSTASWFSLSSIARAVWESLCGSTPIITVIFGSFIIEQGSTAVGMSDCSESLVAARSDPVLTGCARLAALQAPGA
jgi:hypothetical protein